MIEPIHKEKISEGISLNYSKFENFINNDKINSNSYIQLFKDAQNWKQVEEINNKWKEDKDFICMALKGKEIEKTSFSSFFETNEIKYQRRMNRMKSETGGDHFKIKAAVFLVLGIPKKDKENPSEEEYEKRKDCFSLMKKTGFLETDFNVLDEVNYCPLTEVKNFFYKNPNCTTIALGCYQSVTCNPSLCCEKKDAINWHEKAMTVDLEPGSCDVIADFHDPKFWEYFSSPSLDQIADHTNGSFLFDHPSSKNTLENIYKALKKGGIFSTFFTLSEDDIKIQNLITSCGFKKIDENNWKKPN